MNCDSPFKELLIELQAMKVLTDPKDHQARHQPAELTQEQKVEHPPPHHYHAPPTLD